MATSVASRSMNASDVVESFTLEFPGLELTQVATDLGLFTRVVIPGVGVSSEVGSPELPVYRKEFLLESGAEYACRATVSEQREYGLRQLEMPTLVLPSRRSVPKIPGAWEAAALELDLQKYVNGHELAEPARLTDLGMQDGRKHLLLEVFPVAFEAEGGQLTLRKRIDVEIVSTAPALALTRTASAGGSPTNRLLIVSADTLVPSLSGFVAHKEAIGWTVDLVSTTEAGTSREAIRDHIQARYALAHLRPSHLLLVGDSDTIPVWTGQGAYTADTDLYYACMDGPEDWLPDLAYGRLPARTTGQLSNMVQKILFHELSVSDTQSFVSNAMFAASSDNYTVTEGTHNTVVTRHMDPRSYVSDKLYSYTYGATSTQVQSSLNSGCGLAIYSGHAYSHKWRDPSIEISDVYALTNDWMCPFVLSFACDSGSFATLNECFAEAWLRADETSGAVAMLASSEDSYWEEDDIFQQCLFAAVFEDGERALGNVVRRAKERYLAYYGPTSETLQYFEQYTLFGDPTMAVVVLDGASVGDLVSATRDLPDNCLESNATFTVGIDVWVTNPPPSALIIKEKLPTGWSITDATWNGSPMSPTFATGEYKWLFGVGTAVGSGTLVYTVSSTGNTGDVHAIIGSLLYGTTTVATLGDQEVRFCQVVDTDADGIPDDWELLHGLSPTNGMDAAEHWDVDGYTNLEEYLADTNPTNAASALAVTEIQKGMDGVTIQWQGGTQAIQYLETATDLTAPNPWTLRQILVPPTTPAGSWTNATSPTNTTVSFRLRVTR